MIHFPIFRRFKNKNKLYNVTCVVALHGVRISAGPHVLLSHQIGARLK